MEPAPAGVTSQLDRPAPSAAARWAVAAAAGGIAAAIASVAIIGALHVLPPSSYVDPMRRTISEYALLDDGWIFTLAVLLLAAGSLSILVGLVRARVLAAVSAGALFLLLWTAALVVVVVFEKHNWAVGPSAGGYIHRVASLVGFLSLPIGAVTVAGRWLRTGPWRVYARWVFGLGVLSLLAFSPIAYAYLTASPTGLPWWQTIPLGGTERLLALCEVAAVLAMGIWTAAAARSR